MAEALASYRSINPDAKRAGSEWHGPCPVCGGEDRFWISETRLGCRGCQPGKSNPEAFKAIMEALGLTESRDDDGRLPSQETLRAEMTERRHREAAAKAQREEEGRIDYACRIWERALDAEGTPAAHYLRLERRVWPPEMPLPASIRWLDRRTFPGGWPRNAPQSASGAAVWRYSDYEGQTSAVGLEALTASGKRAEPRWRRTHGIQRGALFQVAGPGSNDNRQPAMLHVAEGPLDALACRWLARGPAISTCGTSGLASLEAAAVQGYAHVMLHVDGDSAGRVAALQAISRLEASGIRVQATAYRKGEDPARRLSDIVLQQNGTTMPAGSRRRPK